jgi:hypothetical protein
MPIRRLVYLSFILTLFSLSAQEQDSPEIAKLEWETVEGAFFYLVEIEEEGLIIHAIKTEDSFLPLFLNPGKYRVRINVFNKFEKIASQGDWTELNIYPSPQPLILDYNPDFFYDDTREIILTIEGRHFDKDCRFYLMAGQDQVEGIEKERREEGNKIICTVVFSHSLLPERSLWDLAVTNPSQKKFQTDSAIRFGPRITPKIESLSPSLLYIGENPGTLTLRGENFSNKATLIINGPSPVTYSHLQIYYGEEISFLLDMDEMRVGTYTIQVENERNVLSNKYSFTLEERPLKKAEITQKKRESGESPSFYLGINYHGTFFMDQSTLLFNDSLLGAGLSFRKKFNNSGVYKIPIIREAGVALNLDYTHFVDIYEDYLTVDQMQTMAELFYLSQWDKPINLYFELGFGLSYTYYSFEEKSDQFSFDLINSLGGGVQFDIRNIPLEVGLKFNIIHLETYTLSMAQPYFMVGRYW